MKLTSKSRNSLPAADFGLPGERKFPLENASHARNAKARASGSYALEIPNRMRYSIT